MTRYSHQDFALPDEVEPVLGDSEFLYAANPGNAGDPLIHCSTPRFFDRRGWTYVSIPLDTPPEATAGKVVVFGGDGNMVPLYRQASEFIARHSPKAAWLILLPHGTRGRETLLASLNDRCMPIARDETSHRHLLDHAPNARCFLARDGARRFWPLFSTRTLIWRNTKRMIRRVDRLIRARRDRKTLNAFRNDAERTDIARPRDNIDASQGWAADDLLPLNSFETTYRVIQYLNSFRRINTNRLHVAIRGAMLGKEVHPRANSYGKNEDIHRHSLAGRFPNVVWEG